MAKKSTRRSGTTILRSLLSGWCVMLALALVLLPLLTALALGTDDPSARISPYATVTLVLLSLTAGFASAAFYKKRGLLVGLLAGLGPVVFLLLGALALGGSGSAVGRLVSALTILILSTLGGLMGGAKRSRRRPRLR